MPAEVNIYHGAFRDEDVNKRVFSYTDYNNLDSQILDRAFEMFNAPPEFLRDKDVIIANLYRDERLRSLSVDDVVEIDGVRHQCLGIGWDLEENVKKAKEERLVKYHGQYMKRTDVAKRREEARKDLLEGIDKMIEAEKKKEIDKGIEDLKKNGWKEVIEPWP
tara:strand:- start:90 stop:578 length:489 start_codon:yes stop_codon:yes gene_type:complete